MLATLASAAAEAQDVFPLLTGVSRLLGYLGFVLVVGTTFFLSWLWPGRSVEWVFIRLFRSGAVLVLVATALVAFFGADASLGDTFAGKDGAAAFARMALVALGVAFSWEMLGDARRWRIPIVVWQLLLIETYVLESDAWREPWQLVKVVATTGHLAATAAWLGGLLALAAILVPSAHLEVLHDVLPRFSVVAIVSVVTLVVTGALLLGSSDLLDPFVPAGIHRLTRAAILRDTVSALILFTATFSGSTVKGSGTWRLTGNNLSLTFTAPSNVAGKNQSATIRFGEGAKTISISSRLGETPTTETYTRQ